MRGMCEICRSLPWEQVRLQVLLFLAWLCGTEASKPVQKPSRNGCETSRDTGMVRRHDCHMLRLQHHALPA